MLVLAHHPPYDPYPLALFIPGHADMTKYEWATNQHRDTMASHVGHYDQLSYYAVAQNESVGRVRAQMLEKMLEPCGPPPTKKKQQEN
jgi:splicing factor 3B subunit 5